MALSFDQPSGCKLLAVAAALDKRYLQGGNLPVEQVIGLVDQADQRIGSQGGVVVFEPVRLERPALLICQRGKVRRISMIRSALPELFW